MKTINTQKSLNPIRKSLGLCRINSLKRLNTFDKARVQQKAAPSLIIRVKQELLFVQQFEHSFTNLGR